MAYRDAGFVEVMIGEFGGLTQLCATKTEKMAYQIRPENKNTSRLQVSLTNEIVGGGSSDRTWS